MKKAILLFLILIAGGGYLLYEKYGNVSNMILEIFGGQVSHNTIDYSKLSGVIGDGTDELSEDELSAIIKENMTSNNANNDSNDFVKNLKDMAKDLSGDFDIEQGKIIKIYNATDEGATHLSYAVRWKGKEIIVPASDGLITGARIKKVGEKLTFMVHRVSMTIDKKDMKMLTFIALEN